MMIHNGSKFACCPFDHNVLVDFIDVDLAHQLADATPGHAQLRWAALRICAQEEFKINEYTKDATTACAAAARDGDADAMSCVRELAKIGGPIANFIVFTSAEAVYNGDEEGASAPHHGPCCS